MHPGGEMVDARDLKSLGRKAVPVRVRPRVFAATTCATGSMISRLGWATRGRPYSSVPPSPGLRRAGKAVIQWHQHTVQ